MTEHRTALGQSACAYNTCDTCMADSQCGWCLGTSTQQAQCMSTALGAFCGSGQFLSGPSSQCACTSVRPVRLRAAVHLLADAHASSTGGDTD